jgi:hypothetical protein
MNPAHSSIRIRRLAALALLGIATVTAIYVSGITRSDATDLPPVAPRDLGRPADLPLPSTLSIPQYEEKLFAFLNSRDYVKLGWAHDKSIRDTGSFIDGRYYGTHPAVRVYYSPGVMKWLIGGRVGKIPDGEIIIKEQYAAPAIRHQGKSEEQLWESLESWTVMVKDSAGSHDGWFWSNPAKGQCVVDNHQYPFDHPVSGFGQYCVRCHAATQSPGTQPASDANEFTFISLRNIAGFPGEPIIFRVDDSWRKEEKKESNPTSAHDSHPTCTRPKPPERPVRKPDSAFLAYFDSLKPVELAKVQHLPPVTHDHVVTRRDKHQEFVTSNQCMSCHAGLVAPFGPSMFIPTAKSTDYGAPGWDVSPHGEWRWTPMGLAGRDPVFFAQLESEMRLLKEQFKDDPATAKEYADTLASTCLRCHGAMGKRQFDLDHSDGVKKFSLDHVHATTGHADHKYGALARDGVSCTVCHRMQPRPQPPEDKRPYLQFFLESSITGNFHLGPKGELYGPFKDDEISPYVMEHATGVKPKHNTYLKSSQLCGTCHTVALPAVDMPLEAGHDQDEVGKTQNVGLFQKFHHHVEQATYLEWLNSEYENEINTKNPKAKSCQDCHMSAGLKDDRNGIDIAQIQTRIAAIQDTTYPDAENLAPHKELNVRLRESGYRRHNFTGLNVFLVEMFNQFDDVLGVRKTDFMTGSTKDLENAVQNFLRTARHETATVQVTAEREDSNRLTARVLLQNKAGHRFPSGVGFRRAFLELVVVEPAVRGGPERVVWSSGRTNELGVLLGSDGKPLATESFDRDGAGNQSYQPHHAVISSPEQVQVYETLLKDSKGNFTTSFVRGCEIVKDNRLLPRGWKKEGPGPALTGRFLEATYPDPATGADPRYSDGSGTDEVTYKIDLPAGTDPTRLRVRATLYYQAMPPYFLRNLFTTAPDGPATQRLHHLASHLNLKGTPIEDWKLKITSAESNVGP